MIYLPLSFPPPLASRTLMVCFVNRRSFFFPAMAAGAPQSLAALVCVRLVQRRLSFSGFFVQEPQLLSASVEAIEHHCEVRRSRQRLSSGRDLGESTAKSISSKSEIVTLSEYVIIIIITAKV